MAYEPTRAVEVRAWGRTVGALAPGGRGSYAFRYSDDWIRTGYALSPLQLPLQRRLFAGEPGDTWHGLPTPIADSLPDRFGNAVINAWMARHGVAARAVTALDRLAYLGSRALGALEFVPERGPRRPEPSALRMNELIGAARDAVAGTLGGDDDTESALRQIIAVGTSAGGARAKAIVNIHGDSGEIVPGHRHPSEGWQAWLLKLDGVSGADLGESMPYGRIEYAYSLMARAAGIDMPETRLLTEHGRAHFMARRFDRPDGGGTLHMQTLCGLAGLDYNLVGVHDYGQLFDAVDALELGAEARRQAFRRMVFNVAAANCDDHTKNHSFLMTESGEWMLSPAYDITHAYNPDGPWTSQHLMGIDGVFSGLTRDDLMRFADRYEVPGASGAIADVLDALDAWGEFAETAGLSAPEAERVRADFVDVA